MIQADTRELEAKLRQTVVEIREKEVSLFTDQFAVLASSATFMSSLGFGALNMEIGFLDREDGEYCSELVGCDGAWDRVLTPLALFYAFAAAGVAFNLLAVILASFCMIFGPELAIRGTEASMHHAVKGMYEERRQALKFFWVGCLFIVLSGVALGFMKFPKLTAFIITAVFASLVIFCVVFARRLMPKFAYEDNDDEITELQESVEGVAHTNSMRLTAAHQRMALLRRAANGNGVQRQPQTAHQQQQDLNASLYPLHASSSGGKQQQQQHHSGGHPPGGSSGASAPAVIAGPAPKNRAAAAKGAKSRRTTTTTTSSTTRAGDQHHASTTTTNSGGYGAFASTFLLSGSGRPGTRAGPATRGDDDLDEKSGNVFVENMLRYAVLADGLLRLFSLDGRELSSHAATEIRVGRDKFWVPGADATLKTDNDAANAGGKSSSSSSKADAPAKKRAAYRACAGTTERDTADWLRVLDRASHRLAAQRQQENKGGGAQGASQHLGGGGGGPRADDNTTGKKEDGDNAAGSGGGPAAKQPPPDGGAASSK